MGAAVVAVIAVVALSATFAVVALSASIALIAFTPVNLDSITFNQISYFMYSVSHSLPLIMMFHSQVHCYTFFPHNTVS